MVWKRSFFFIFLLTILTASSFSAPSRYVYYSDQQNPPETQGEPPFEGTRSKVNWSNGYLLTRYPYQKIERLRVRGNGGSLLCFKISVGNELEHPVFYRVIRVEVKYQGRSLPLLISFYNEAKNDTEAGLTALKQTEIRSDPSMHGDLVFEIPDWQESLETLDLELDVLIKVDEKKEETLHPSIKLYRGYYTA